MKKNPSNASLRRPPFYLTIATLVAIAALALFLLSNRPVAISAQGTDEKPRATKVATPAMLTLALNFGAAADYSVFADKGVAKGNSRIVGKRMRAGVAENNEVGARPVKGAGQVTTLNHGVGLYFSSTFNSSAVFLKNDLTPGPADFTFTFGSSSVSPYHAISGDWNNDGRDTLGLYDQADRKFFPH